LYRETHNAHEILYRAAFARELRLIFWFIKRLRQESYFVENGREYIIGLYDAYRFKALLNNVEFINNVPEFPQKKIEFEKFAKTINETDNPVFMIIRLKN
jgi:hypothetical protein